MNDGTKLALGAFACILGLMAVSYFGLIWSGVLGTKAEAIRTEIFKESQSYTDGKQNELNRLYLEYQKADSAGRIGISNVVRDTFANVDTTGYSSHLQTFLTTTGAK